MSNIQINNENYGVIDSTLISHEDTTLNNEMKFVEDLISAIPNAVILTQEEYNALGSSVNNDNVVYYIVDADANGEAIRLAYSNRTTGIAATNTQAALDTCYSHLNQGKEKIVETLTKLGVSANTDESFQKLAEKTSDMLVAQEELGRVMGTDAGIADCRVGTAIASEVLEGTTFTNSAAADIPGTMKNNGAVSSTLKPGPSESTYTIPQGYHNGQGTVSITAEQAKASSMTLTINQGCYYDGDSSSYAAINVQGYNKLSRTRTGSNNVNYVWLLAYDASGTETTIHSSTSDISNLDISKYVYLQQKFRAKEPSSKPYFSSTITISV